MNVDVCAFVYFGQLHREIQTTLSHDAIKAENLLISRKDYLWPVKNVKIWPEGTLLI